MTVMLLGLPLTGVFLAGFPVQRYLEFPPYSRYVFHAPFSWEAFMGYTIFILCFTVPLTFGAVKSFRQINKKSTPLYAFPWWGWFGIISGIVSWILAWTRFSWFVKFQPHTFTPLWLSFIIVINALCHRKTGRCMMIVHTRFFLLLFPLSAVFWWFFEYLNRFVQNWSYTGVHFSSWEYFCYATLSFSTVLPAVLGTRDLFHNAHWISPGFDSFKPFKCSHSKIWAFFSLAISGIGLACIGVWPNHFFSLLWMSPLIIIISLQILMGEQHILSDIAAGHWSRLISFASAALFCGFFWEMWNYYSLAKWEYSIPFVYRFKIFEMPILGYAGYLPFGLECAVIGDLLARSMKTSGNRQTTEIPV
ncbi:MAG: hypothetical protein R6W88_04690 [Desulfobacterales bacterium]